MIDESAPSPDKRKLAAIRALAAAGYTLIPVCSPTVPHEHMSDGRMRPCRSPGKVPPRFDWGETAYGQYDPAALAAGENYGVVLRAGDLVVDVDPRNFSVDDDPLKRLAKIVGPLASFTVRTGGGGLHIYLQKPADLLISQALGEFPGLEFKTAGRQVVGPGSLHAESGNLYEIAAGSPAGVAEAPPALLELLRRVPVDSAEGRGTGSYQDDTETRGRFTAYLQDAAPASGTYAVACRGRDFGLPPAVTLELMLEVWNKRRNAPKTPEEMREKVAHAYRYAKGAVGVAHPAADFEALLPEKEEPKAPWVLDKHNHVTKCFKNLLNYLRPLKLFAKNDFTGRVEYANPAPWHPGGQLPAARGVTDHDLHLLKGHLVERHRFEISCKEIEVGVTNVAYEQRFHPVREYLACLEWDKKKRIDSWMKNYLGAVDQGYPEYLAAVSRKILVAAVARVLRPGISFDHVPVFEGDQDIGKSTVIRILGGEWASDAPIDPHNRDTVDAMQGRWIIEMAEMEVLRKTDDDALKAFITRPTDRARLAYGRSTADFPRQSVFIATKNPGPDGTYLKDSTGWRRWWPVRLEPKVDRHTGLRQIDFRGLRAVRDQLFAEAVEAARALRRPEELSMHTSQLKNQAKAVASERHAEHEWTERVADWIAQQDARPETRREFLTSRDVFVDGMGGSDSRFDRRAMLAVSTCLSRLGWERRVVWRAGRPVRGYVRGEQEQDRASMLVGML